MNDFPNQTTRLAVHVPSIGPCDIHVRTDRGTLASLLAYDRTAGRWVLAETPETVAELLAAAGVVLR